MHMFNDPVSLSYGISFEKKNSPFIIHFNKILIYIFPTISNSTNLAALFRADAPAVLWVTDWPFFSGRLFLLPFNPFASENCPPSITSTSNAPFHFPHRLARAKTFPPEPAALLP